MENMIKALGNKKFYVRIYEINEHSFKDSEITYFELATYILTQDFIKIEIRKKKVLDLNNIKIEKVD